MSESDQDKYIDQWVAEVNKHVGEMKIPPLGEYPPDLECFYGSLMNEYVTTDLIRHFADSIGDRNPLWRYQDYAVKTRWGGIIAPPTFTDAIIQPYAGNMVVGSEIIPKFKSFFVLPDGSTRRLFQPIRPGDKLRAVQYALGVKETVPYRPKPAREFEDTVRRVLINQREEVVAVLDRHMKVVINHAYDADHPYWMKRRKRRLTDQERDAIQHAYDTQTRRGAEILYWEDVNVGDELKPLLVGPIAIQDVFAAYTVMAGHAVGFDLEWERVKTNFDFHWLDPEINAWTTGGVCHVLDDKGHATIWDGGAAVGFFVHAEWILGRMLTDWMGDNGFLRMMDDRCDPVYPIVGDVLHAKGRVCRKYTEGNEHLVDVKIHCENQDNLVIMQGTATVQLPSRTDYLLNGLPRVTCKLPDIAKKLGDC
ncbi:MAG: MaoC family dehydratase [Peptococcaceae bacterium]|nr:MaoC family dehydratase [Peptococcaceae bacterium]